MVWYYESQNLISCLHLGRWNTLKNFLFINFLYSKQLLLSKCLSHTIPQEKVWPLGILSPAWRLLENPKLIERALQIPSSISSTCDLLVWIHSPVYSFKLSLTVIFNANWLLLEVSLKLPRLLYSCYPKISYRERPIWTWFQSRSYRVSPWYDSNCLHVPESPCCCTPPQISGA